MEKKYKSIHIFFIIILALVPIGFKRYFIKLFNEESINNILHIHTLVMGIWCLLLIIQPILIRKRKNKAHKLIGKLSYLFFPLVVYTICMIIVYSFERMKTHLSLDENLSQLFLPISQLFLFVLFYILAMLNVKKLKIHMRYIIVSSVALFGPTIGRIDFGLDSFNADLWFMDLCLVAFLIYDTYYKKDYKPYLVGCILFFLMHIGSIWFSDTYLWREGAKIILM
ncbi:hypothetical protein [Pontimicrobium sp. SW4]|uniref:Uncharacterized protein n=1 Tax=Pontimicrobium sp. SW4 TaxID=3153519 RepID=A0AAU7BUH3_9FLAO